MREITFFLFFVFFLNENLGGQNLPEQWISDSTQIEGAPLPLKNQLLEPNSTKSILEIQEKVKAGVSMEEAILEGEYAEKQKALPVAKIYGQELFRNKSIAVFRNSKNIKPPKDYVLGVGDELTISIFGGSLLDVRFVIGENGYILPERMPKIFLKGLRLEQAEKLLKNRFSKFYRFNNGQFAFNLTTARTITVNIFGEVNHSGSFNLPAINTAFNALVAAGGPNDIGSVRNIKVTRDGKAQKLDVYEFMSNPESQFRFFLNNNDIIHIPVANRVVTIEGAIRRPFKYELKPNENLNQLIKYAGGLPPNAYTKLIQVKRFDKGNQKLIDVNLDKLLETNSDFQLKPGDKINIRQIEAGVENYVEIKGPVELPGKYALATTPRISDLIDKGSLKPETKLDIAFLSRVNSDKTTKLIQLNLGEILRNKNGEKDLLLQKQDQLILYSQERFIDQTTIKVTGAVREPIEHSFNPDSTLTLQQAIYLAGGLKSDARNKAYLIRTNLENIREKKYLEVDIKAAVANPLSAANISLQPLDELKVLSEVSFTDETTITISGEVRNPGEFRYAKSIKLKDLIALSGGLKLGAALNRIDIYSLEREGNNPFRTVVRTLKVDSSMSNTNGLEQNIELKPYDELVVRTIPNFEFQKYVQLNGEAQYPGRYALIDENESLLSIIKRAGGITNEAFAEGATLFRSYANKGWVLTKLDEVLTKENSPYNYILKEGDVITIPLKEDLVTINTRNTGVNKLYANEFANSGKINVAHSAGKNAKWYIKKYAGGFGSNASKKTIIAEQPNGEILITRNFILFKLYPKVKKGSIISIGAKISKPVKKT